MKKVYGDDADEKIIAEMANDAYVSYDGWHLYDPDHDKDSDRVLFYDFYSQRFFNSPMGQVINAEYHINRNLQLRGDVTVNEFYDFLGLEQIPGGDNIGWILDDLMAGGLMWLDFDNRFTTMEGGMECHIISPAWNGGVQKSALSNIGSISGLNSRRWTKHGKLPYILYAKSEDTITFPDIAGHYAKNNINKLCSYGVLSGYEDGTFKPDNPVTRAEFATMTTNALEKACSYALDMVSAFTDISGHWAEKAITKMVACGIVNGFEDNTFKPDKAITRGQASIIASNMLSYCGIQRRDSDGFPDTIGHYAEHHIKSLKAFGVVNGYEDGLFRPDEEITRGQAAMYIANCLTVLGK